jgi:hypothetical protein
LALNIVAIVVVYALKMLFSVSPRKYIFTEWRFSMDKEGIMKKIGLTAKEGKISCKKALEFADETGISPKALGDLLNEMEIKVRGCQLGCFR